MVESLKDTGLTIGGGEVLLTRKWFESVSDEEIVALIREFQAISGHAFWQDKPGNLYFHSRAEFYESLQEDKVRKSSADQKKALTSFRRSEFDRRRPDLQLALIDRDGYVCAWPECGETSALTIDHIVPISKGGTDELDNLRFLCRSHNSIKGDSHEGT